LSWLGSAENEVAKLAPHWFALSVLGLIVPELSIEPDTDLIVGMLELTQVLPAVVSLGRIRQVSVGLLVEIDVV
jgi:hypothetical protein